MLLALHNIAVISVTIAGKSVRDGYFLSRFDRSALPLMMFAIAVAVSIAVPLLATDLKVVSDATIRHSRAMDSISDQDRTNG